MRNDARVGESTSDLRDLANRDSFVDEFQQAIRRDLEATRYRNAPGLGHELRKFLGVGFLEANIGPPRHRELAFDDSFGKCAQ